MNAQALRICAWHPQYFGGPLVLGDAGQGFKGDTHGMCVACYLTFLYGQDAIPEEVRQRLRRVAVE